MQFVPRGPAIVTILTRKAGRPPRRVASDAAGGVPPGPLGSGVCRTPAKLTFRAGKLFIGEF